MSRIAILAALAIPVICIAAPAAAASSPPPCDPEICGKGKLTAEELREDRDITYRLNREQLEYVQRRDAEYAEQRRRNEAALREYERQRAEYERRMEEWREAVRRCEAGDVRYCAG